jgi:hypothetical protein
MTEEVFRKNLVTTMYRSGWKIKLNVMLVAGCGELFEVSCYFHIRSPPGVFRTAAEGPRQRSACYLLTFHANIEDLDRAGEIL